MSNRNKSHHDSDPFQHGYMLGMIEMRVTAIEGKISVWEEAVKTYAKRGAIIFGVWGLAALVNLFPGTTIAQYAEALRLALMQH